MADLPTTSERQRLIDRLRRGKDRRSIGEADQIAADAMADTDVLDALVGLMSHSDPGVAMRAADALEKATRERASALNRHADVLLAMIASIEQQEVRWHLAPLVARLELGSAQAEQVATQLEDYLDDDSQIVRVNTLQALTDIAGDHPVLLEGVTELVSHHHNQGGPAVRAR